MINIDPILHISIHKVSFLIIMKILLLLLLLDIILAEVSDESAIPQEEVGDNKERSRGLSPTRFLANADEAMDEAIIIL